LPRTCVDIPGKRGLFVLLSNDQRVRHLLFVHDIPRFDLPVYFFTGRYDYNTPFELVEEFHESLDAPHKEIVWFENSAHMPNLEESDLYQEVLVQKVLAHTVRAGEHSIGATDKTEEEICDDEL